MDQIDQVITFSFSSVFVFFSMCFGLWHVDFSHYFLGKILYVRNEAETNNNCYFCDFFCFRFFCSCCARIVRFVFGELCCVCFVVLLLGWNTGWYLIWCVDIHWIVLGLFVIFVKYGNEMWYLLCWNFDEYDWSFMNTTTNNAFGIHLVFKLAMLWLLWIWMLVQQMVSMCYIRVFPCDSKVCLYTSICLYFGARIIAIVLDLTCCCTCL